MEFFSGNGKYLSEWVLRVVLGEVELGLGWLPHKYYCTLIGATLDNVLTFSNCPK